MWLTSGYAMTLAVVGLSQAQDIKFRAAIARDSCLWRHDFEVALQKVREIQRHQTYLQQHGCPMGLNCTVKGSDREETSCGS